MKSVLDFPWRVNPLDEWLFLLCLSLARCASRGHWGSLGPLWARDTDVWSEEDLFSSNEPLRPASPIMKIGATGILSALLAISMRMQHRLRGDSLVNHENLCDTSCLEGSAPSRHELSDWMRIAGDRFWLLFSLIESAETFFMIQEDRQPRLLGVK
jgi:hypothetical protein